MNSTTLPAAACTTRPGLAPDELAAWLRLAATPGVGNDTARRLLAAFGLPQAVFAQSRQALQQVVSPRIAHELAVPPEGFDALLASTQTWLDEPGVPRRVLPLGHADYPPALLAIEDPPVLLYAMGRVERLATAVAAVALVGSRHPTPQGVLNARQFARALVQSGFTVVSGLALGIDAAAHQGALEGVAALAPGDPPLATVAVVGTGLDRVYPAAHRTLARAIAEQGVILSEYPIGTPPLTGNFPKRNRLIAGLSLGTLVVEAALKSGSLITARLANEQGKEVLAIPGSIHAVQSRGCHALIKQGAKLVEGAEDVIEELLPQMAVAGRLPARSGPVPAPPPAVLPREGPSEHALEAHPDALLLEALGHDPVSLDALAARTGLDAAALQAGLLALELDGCVGRLPGGLFQRLARA